MPKKDMLVIVLGDRERATIVIYIFRFLFGYLLS